MKNSNTPYIHCYVNGNYLGVDTWVECYIIMVTALLNRPFLWTCHTEHGALFSRLPIDAFSPNPLTLLPPVNEVCQNQPFSAISNDIEVVEIDYLKDYTVNATGSYVFSIDGVGGVFSEDPEQHKIMHLIEYKDRYEILPNNQCEFTDDHFTGKDRPQYRRNSVYFYAKS